MLTDKQIEAIKGGSIMSKELSPEGALLALAEGKKIHRKGLPEDAYGGYIYIENGIIMSEDGHVEHIACFRDYHIYEEPPKKVKMWQWAYKTGNKRPRQTSAYYTSEQDAINAIFPGKLIKRLDHTEIEVEV